MTNKTRSKNIRKKRRNGKNIFWVVLSTYKGNNIPLLFSREPVRRKVLGFKEEFDEDWQWFSVHSQYWPYKNGLKNVVVDKYTPVKVMLELCKDGDECDMYIQRYHDCLFISSHLSSYRCGSDFFSKLHVQVPHNFMISNKLFPEVTEKSGVKGVKIVHYKEEVLK